MQNIESTCAERIPATAPSFAFAVKESGTKINNIQEFIQNGQVPKTGASLILIWNYFGCSFHEQCIQKSMQNSMSKKNKNAKRRLTQESNLILKKRTEKRKKSDLRPKANTLSARAEPWYIQVRCAHSRHRARVCVWCEGKWNQD